jgi:hypothetical protein
MEQVLMVVFVAAIIIAIIYLAHLQAKARRRAMAALAVELGWRFDPSNDHGHSDTYSDLDPFDSGRNRVAYNTLTGSIDVLGRRYAARAGDYRYTTGSGKNRRTHTLSYLILHLPLTRTPSLTIRREGVFDKVAGAIGFDDIDFESEEFSRRFFVKSGDKRFAYDVVHPRTMEFLMMGEAPALELKDRVCCIWEGRDSTWSPSEFKQRIWWAREFFELWPDYLTSQLDI